MIKIKNNCPFTIWPGIQGNPGHGHLGNGGNGGLSKKPIHLIRLEIGQAGFGAELNAIAKENDKRAIAVSLCYVIILLNIVIGLLRLLQYY